MKALKFFLFILTFSLGLGMMMSSGSYASSRVNLVDTGVVSIERKSLRGASIKGVYAYDMQGRLVVIGHIKRPKTFPGLVGGHVDVTVIDPSGEILVKESTLYLPRVLSRRSHRGSTFSASFASIPPKGSIVKVLIHPGDPE